MKVEKMLPHTTEFTLQRKEQYIKNVRETGHLALSAELVGIAITTANRHRKDDPNFDARVKEAKQCWIDETLISAAVTRAVEGVEQPIIGGKDRDEIVAYRTVYSDSLLQMLIKGQRPEEYGTQTQQQTPKESSGIMVMPAPPMSASDWQEKYTSLAKGEAGKPNG